ncbi:amidophosphoribosyltransferase [Clostridium vitabionis]|uniref:amidophosphoribosyltransferase n=1 Tax=Clostridium vitabionis TaxID=2784388 RepID=UPI00188DC55B|nr:amidophosphoribosyltransferase [Clostridium vitabionis]
MNPSVTGVHEECGVFGIYDIHGGDVAHSVYYGLSALQHRGQESCGIAVTDTNGPFGKVDCHRGLGLVNEVFHSHDIEKLHGNLGVGHVRYSTTGATTIENTQPLVLNYIKGTLCLAHNGNLVNAAELRQELEQTGALFTTTIDSEVIAYLIAKERINAPTAEEAVVKACGRLRGAYALVVSSPRKLMGIRDPYGLRPLCIGRRDDAWIIASESCAISSVGGTFIRDVEPGEIVSITPEGIQSYHLEAKPARAHCVFEYIYFARLDSKIDQISVYEARRLGGKILAREFPAEADLVAGVPDSGLTAAYGFAEASGIPFGMVFHKNSYVGRTFIKPTQEEREDSVKIKLNVIEPAVRGKRLVLVDDSIVRGTTMKNLIRDLKKAGALEVHVRISSPPFLYPCYFGTDVPGTNSLIAHQHSVEEIQKEIGADSLGYMTVDGLREIAGGLPICNACFTGKYPMEVPDHEIRDALESGCRHC